MLKKPLFGSWAYLQIDQLVRSMETALRSDEGFDRELKRLEYKLPLFNDQLKKNHTLILNKICDLTKEEIATKVPEATMVSTTNQKTDPNQRSFQRRVQHGT